MQITDVRECQACELERLAFEVFSESENEAEGRLVSRLVARLTAEASEADVQGWAALDDEGLAGLVFFSRLRVGERPDIAMLSPLAVRTNCQRTGVGRRLVEHAFEQLASQGVTIVTTYGDPAYYGRLGFRHLPQSVLPAPHELSFPEGWLGRTLGQEGSEVPVVPGRCVCVRAFDDPLYW